MQKIIWRLLPLLTLIALLILFFYFQLERYVSFNALKEHRSLLVSWTQTHYALAVLLFMGVYITAVAISVPGAIFLTLTGGFLFGIVWGTVFVVISATIGATLLFFAVRTALNEWLNKKTAAWIVKMREGFQKNAFSYLFMLRLIPLFPFWVVNIVPGLLNVRTKTFILATFLGIIPGSLIYVMVGNGLGYIFDSGDKPDLAIIFTPKILLPLIGLALLSIVPLIFQRLHKDKHAKKN